MRGAGCARTITIFVLELLQMTGELGGEACECKAEKPGVEAEKAGASGEEPDARAEIPGSRAEELEERTSELEERTSEHVECKADRAGARLRSRVQG